MNSQDLRRVIDHTIVSDELPGLEIAVDPSFDFVGILSFVLKDIALVERVIFVDGRSSNTTRLFIVQFEGILEHSSSKYTYPTTNPIQLGNHAYQHGVYIYSNAESVRAGPGAESDRTTQFLRERGYTFEDGLAMSRFARIVDDLQRHEIIIFYQETLHSLGHSLVSYAQLTAEAQRAFEDALRARSLQNFSVNLD